jgi:hypothetical protein
MDFRQRWNRFLLYSFKHQSSWICLHPAYSCSGQPELTAVSTRSDDSRWIIGPSVQGHNDWSGNMVSDWTWVRYSQLFWAVMNTAWWHRILHCSYRKQFVLAYASSDVQTVSCVNPTAEKSSCENKRKKGLESELKLRSQKSELPYLVSTCQHRLLNAIHANFLGIFFLFYSPILNYNLFWFLDTYILLYT